MFKPRVLLLVLGVLASIFGNSDSYTSSYTYPSQSYTSTSYSSPTYGTSSYSGGGGYESSYSGSCENVKVLEVLDQIFCKYVYARYSNTVYPYINVVIEQIEYLTDYCFLETVIDYLIAAQQTLQTLQDAVYANFEYSTLLAPYEDDDDDDDVSSDGTSKVKGTTSGSTKAQKKMVAAHEKLMVLEKNAKTFKTSRNIKLEKTKKQTSHNAKESHKVKETHKVKESHQVKEHSVKESHQVKEHHAKESHNAKESHSQRAHGGLTVLEVDLGDTVTQARRDVQRNETFLKTLRKRMAKLESEVKSRKARGTEYSSDYTCALLYPVNCDYSKYDDLLYNILDRLWIAFSFLEFAAYETWLFLEEADCDDDDDWWAFVEASITYGAIVTNAYTIYEIGESMYDLYLLLELEYETEGRAAGGSDSSMMMTPIPQPQPQPMMGMVAVQVPMMKRPMTVPSMTTVNRTPATQTYPFSQYVTQSQPVQSTPMTYATSSYQQAYSYPQPQQQPQQQQPSYYRLRRGSTQPSFLVVG